MGDFNDEPRSADTNGGLEAANADEIAVLRRTVSGLYTLKTATPIPAILKDELRLDVDGRYPQMIASGALPKGLVLTGTWIAKLTKIAANHYKGSIVYRESTSFSYTNVDITVTVPSLLGAPTAKVTFTGGGALPITRTYAFASPYFHPIILEYDNAAGTAAVTSVKTHDHPNHPSTIASETLTLEMVYQRAGFDVKRSTGNGTIPLPPGTTWSDAEMHDAMQTYWSQFANKAQWSMWTLFAALHESGTSLGGIMFDDIGPNHRQGTAVFENAFISVPPAGDPNPTAWVRRMRFWTAAHEMGHTFNLAHSWQKSLSSGSLGPWVPLADEPEARSFMNYPYFVAGGEAAFFANFEYRFSDQELLFMRHAPARFVQQGNADWFDHHGFEQAAVSLEPKLRLDLRVDRDKAIFEFLEPIVAECVLTNVSDEPVLIQQGVLAHLENMTVIVKKQGKPARQITPYARYCVQERRVVLMPGESIADAIFLSAGTNGWDLAEPGYYDVQAALHLDEEDVVSAPMRLRVCPPAGYDEEYLAQDFFSDEVGRVLSFDGSRFLTGSNDTLREVSEKLSTRKVAIHANVALGSALMRDFKQLVVKRGPPAGAAAIDGGPPGDAIAVAVARADVDEARRLFERALARAPEAAVQSLGVSDYVRVAGRFTELLADQRKQQDAVLVEDALFAPLKQRKIDTAKLRDLQVRGGAPLRGGSAFVNAPMAPIK